MASNVIETRAFAIINHSYEPETGFKQRISGLADAANIKKFFKNSILNENVKFMIDKSKNDIDDYFNYLYNDARKECFTK